MRRPKNQDHHTESHKAIATNCIRIIDQVYLCLRLLVVVVPAEFGP